MLTSFEALEEDPVFFPDCHGALYYVGALEYERVRDIRDVYARSKPVCFYASYHGVLEGYFNVMVGAGRSWYGDAELSDAMLLACGNPSDYSSSLVYDQCFHGMGHALMVFTGGDLVRSLALCDVLKKKQDIEFCYSGVFMEGELSATHRHYARQPGHYDDPNYPCTVLADRYKTSCYASRPQRYYTDTNLDPYLSVANCYKTPREYRERCFSEAGANQVYILHNVNDMRYCDIPLEPEYQIGCVKIASQILVLRYAGKVAKASAYCAKVVAPEHREACFREIGFIIPGIISDDATRRERCRETGETSFVEWCEKGLDVGISNFDTRYR